MVILCLWVFAILPLRDDTLAGLRVSTAAPLVHMLFQGLPKQERSSTSAENNNAAQSKSSKHPQLPSSDIKNMSMCHEVQISMLTRCGLDPGSRCC